KAPRDAIVMSDGHAGQPGTGGADDVPSRRVKADEVTRRRHMKAAIVIAEAEGSVAGGRGRAAPHGHGVGGVPGSAVSRRRPAPGTLSAGPLDSPSERDEKRRRPYARNGVSDNLPALRIADRLRGPFRVDRIGKRVGPTQKISG